MLILYSEGGNGGIDVALVERGRGRVKGEGERKGSLLLGKGKYSPCPREIY